MDPSTISAGPVLAASIASALAVGLFVWSIANVVVQPRPDHLLPTDSERSRRRHLRAANGTYRWFEPLIDSLAAINKGLQPLRVVRLQRELDLFAAGAPWRADEFIAARQLEGLLVLPIGAVAGAIVLSPVISPIVGLMLAYGYQEFMVWQVSKQAQRYVTQFRIRLPYVIDLMAVITESGATLMQSLETIVRENKEHPIGQQFAGVHSSIQRGVPKESALADFQRRFDDADVSEMVSAINLAERLGTPLHQTLRNIADQLRIRQSQWLDRLAEEAKVHITWPGMVIMLACLLIVAGPLILSALEP